MAQPQKQMEQPDAFARETLESFDKVFGFHPGFRPAHAKGILLSGVFVPAHGVEALTKAPHVSRPSIRVEARFSDGTGIPNIPDFDENANPRGCAVRFYLADHVHTDIIAHSTNGFPTRTAEELVEFLRAIAASGPDAPKPTPIEAFLGSHPAALAFAQAPKPIPASFAKDSYYGINAYKFTNREGASTFGRYRIVPADGNAYLDKAAAAKQSPDFLFDEIKARIGHGGAKMRIVVQLAAEGDTVDDSTVQWPEGRAIAEFGTIELNAVVPNGDAEQRHIIFDPIPRVDGIESSGDPLLDPRASIYLASGRRRRAAAV